MKRCAHGGGEPIEHLKNDLNASVRQNLPSEVTLLNLMIGIRFLVEKLFTDKQLKVHIVNPTHSYAENLEKD